MKVKGSNGHQAMDELNWSNQVVLLTGGTGSFGRKFTEVMLSSFRPRKLIIFSRDELKQYEMSLSLPESADSPIKYILGDVRDLERLRRSMTGVDIVVHAAAMKQIPACENHPSEAILTNVTGTKNIVEAALDTGVSKVIAISTDKAVNPVSLYGATKQVAERLIVQANTLSPADGPRFSCVRYGNVAASRGSVSSLFLSQRAQGKVTVTDPGMTRFWIDLEFGAYSVVRCLEQMHGGEIFVPKSPSMNIMDLVEAIAPGIEVEYIGIRPGDKLNELLVSEDEARDTIELDDMFVILPPGSRQGRDRFINARTVPNGFTYNSDDNAQRLSPVELAAMLENSERERSL